MVDYLIYQTWASIFQAFFAAVLAFLTVILIILTKQYAKATEKYVATSEDYAETTEDMLKASIIERKIRFYEKRLEKLYMPIYNNKKLFEYLPNSFNESDEMGVNKFIAKIKPYTYLANKEVQSNLEKLLNECGTLSPDDAEAKRNSEDFIKLKEDILNQIDGGAKHDRRLVRRLIMQYRIRYTKSGKPVVKLT